MTIMIENLLKFLESPTPFHAIEHIKSELKHYQGLHEHESWHLEKGGKYYVVRNDGSIIAFKIGKNINAIPSMMMTRDGFTGTVSGSRLCSVNE